MANNKYLIYQDESGEPGKDDVFIVGTLCANDKVINRLIDVVEDVKTTMNFHNELHFQKFSAKRAEVYKEVINRVMPMPILFKTIVVRKQDVNIQKFFKNKRHLAYNKFTELLIYHNIKKINYSNVYVYVDRKDRIREDNFIDYLKSNLNWKAFSENHNYRINTVEPVDSKESIPTQICDLITGALKCRYVPAGERKNEISNYILNHQYSNKIHIWNWRPHR